MYARVFTGQLDPSKVDADRMRELTDETLALLRQQPGFVKFYLLVNPANGKSTQIHFWESEAHLKAYLDSPAATSLRNRTRAAIQDAAVGEPASEHYEVLVES